MVEKSKIKFQKNYFAFLGICIVLSYIISVVIQAKFLHKAELNGSIVEALTYGKTFVTTIFITLLTFVMYVVYITGKEPNKSDDTSISRTNNVDYDDDDE